jgi:predicted Zn-dependent protease
VAARAGALALLVVLGCARVPYTNRSQLILVSPKDEAALGAQAFQQVVSKSRLDPSPRTNRAVQEVGQRLAAVANRPDFQWNFVVIDDDRQVNAFCLPGGKVAVYTGILPVAQDQAGLAVVLGHEIAHAVARHGAERMSQEKLAQLGGAALAIGLGDSASSSAILAAYGLGAQYGVLLPYSRTQESEADTSGSCSWRRQDTIRASPLTSGNAWSTQAAVGLRSSSPRIRATAHASRSYAHGSLK